MKEMPDIQVSSHLASYNVPLPEIRRRYGEPNEIFLAVGVAVFNENNEILLLQRANTDTLPHLWETPGGGCDAEDSSVLHSAARELLEESGLKTDGIIDVVEGEQRFKSSSGKQIVKLTFIASVAHDTASSVKLDPSEHMDYCWSSLKQVQAGQARSRSLEFTSPEQRDVILRAFSSILSKRTVQEGGDVDASD